MRAVAMTTLASILAILLAVVVPASSDTNFPFRVGEKLTFQINWGPFLAGHATLEVAGLETVDGRDCYRLVAKAQTVGLVDLLFHVDNVMESWIDTNQLHSVRYRQHRVEGKHTKKTDTRYDYANKHFTLTNHLTGASCTLPLDDSLRDIVASLYYVRAQQLQTNQLIHFLVNAGDTNRLVRITPDQRKTIWTNPLGDLPALRVEPNPTLTIVSAHKGRMWVWVSDDTHKIPLVLIAKMTVGSARFQLTDVQTTDPTLAKRLRPVSKD
jgi:hypothetical protein